MPKGTVKWFNNAKGYGFILSEDSGSDVFAHYSAIKMDGYKTLKAGQEVFFDLINGDKGVHAANIRAGAVPLAVPARTPGNNIDGNNIAGNNNAAGIGLNGALANAENFRQIRQSPPAFASSSA